MRSTTGAIGLALAFWFGGAAPVAAELLKVSVPQRGQWDTAITELGERAGIFKRHGLDIEVLYTQGGPESHQAVISGAMDLACGGGIESALGAYSRGAPLRIVGSQMIGSPDTYRYVRRNSPIRSLADAAGKTISYSQNGSSSHTALLSLLEQNHISAVPVATGGHPMTLTMTLTGQIDVGRGAAPFGLELAEHGDIRIIARGSEVRERADQTVRVCVANPATIARPNLLARFMQGYRDTIDWMYAGDEALRSYEENFQVPLALLKSAREGYFPKATLWPDEVRGLDLVVADAVKLKFIDEPLTAEQVAELVQVPKPLR
jgi:NitT/TauT family transport system substrate-binding protein